MGWTRLNCFCFTADFFVCKHKLNKRFFLRAVLWGNHESKVIWWKVIISSNGVTRVKSLDVLTFYFMFYFHCYFCLAIHNDPCKTVAIWQFYQRAGWRQDEKYFIYFSPFCDNEMIPMSRVHNFLLEYAFVHLVLYITRLQKLQCISNGVTAA